MTTNDLMHVFAQSLIGCHSVLDPFAGTGRIHRLNGRQVNVMSNFARTHPSQPPQIVTLDLDITAIESSPQEATKVPVIIGDPLKIMPTLSEGSFDAVCTSVNSRNPVAIDMMFRLLRPGGRMILHCAAPELDWHAATLKATGFIKATHRKEVSALVYIKPLDGSTFVDEFKVTDLARYVKE